jgi:Bacterial PH domain
MQLFRPAADHSRVVTFNWLFTLGAMSLAIGIYSLFGRPRVELSVDALVIRGLLHDIVIPWDQVKGVDTAGSTYLQVVTPERSYSALGIERSNWAVVSGDAGAAGASSNKITEFQARLPVSSTGEVTVHRRRPEVVEVLLVVVVWLCYLAASAVKL